MNNKVFKELKELIKRYPNSIDINLKDSKENIIKQFREKINTLTGCLICCYICRFDKLSPEFIEEFKEELGPHLEAEYERLMKQ